MSAKDGDSHFGGSNEDVEADESTRTEDARSIQDIAEGTGVWQDELEERQRDRGLTEAEYEDQVHGFPDDVNELNGERVADVVDEEDWQLDDGTEDVPDIPDDVLSNGPATPVARSPMASPVDPGSIPDDSPSVQGSLLSSPGTASPSPHRTPISRKQRGALQPFERRFEARPSASRSPSSKGGSPARLSPHSRQFSLSSQLSRSSSDAASNAPETPQAPWDVIRWTRLQKITAQAFSEAGKRNFGRPTCLAVSALIAIGTSKGLILGFDYHQTLKIIIGQGTKATECGSVTAISIAADYSTIASGHANGHIFTWEINRPSQPFLRIPPLDKAELSQAKDSDGHVANTAILHIGFLGTRHTALVSADAGGMAFSHLASRGLGPVTRTIATTRLLGRYPALDPQSEKSRKPSSVLAFSSLPLGNVEQPTDDIGLTALLTPYLLVIVSTKPIAQTQHKVSRPKEITPHSTLSGCLAWFPAVRLKNPASGAARSVSDTKLVYCWSNVLTVLDMKITAFHDDAGTNRQPELEFHARSRWRAEEAIVAVQWIGRSVLGVLTVSQRLLIVEDGSLQVTDSIDLLQKHIYHQDLFSQQLQPVVETLDSPDPSLHGVVADAFYMSFRAYKGRTFLLGFDDLAVGSLSNWADRLLALMEAGDHIAAIQLATEYYAGNSNNVTVGLPDDDIARHRTVKERLLAMISASLNYTFSQQDDGREGRLRELAEVCFDACIAMQETDYLFGEIFDMFEEADEDPVFISTLEPYVVAGDVKMLPPDIVKSLVAYFISENQASSLEELLCQLDPHSFDLDQITMLCRQHALYDALIYVWTQGIGDYVTPLVDLLGLIKIMQSGEEDEDLSDNSFFESAMKVFPYLAYLLTGRSYPAGHFLDDTHALNAKQDLYDYLFSGTPSAWPRESKKILYTVDESQEEPAFPYIVLLLRFAASNFMSMLNEAFEDSFLNRPEEDETGVNGMVLANGSMSRTGHGMTRQQIIYILLDVMKQEGFGPEEIIYVDMFIARSLSKYPGQLVLTGSLLNTVLQHLCHPPSDDFREDCQLSVEYLLSAHHPPDLTSLIDLLKKAGFHRVLKSTYRSSRMFTELIEAYLKDPDDKEALFDCIRFCFLPSTGLAAKQVQAVKGTISAHFRELADISTVSTASSLATHAQDLLKPCVEALQDSHAQFVFLRTLLEPGRLPGATTSTSAPFLPQDAQVPFVELYVQLMCQYDPRHVADYVGALPTSDLRLDQVLPAMESSGVIDAAVVLLARDGLARNAMDRLVSHLQSLQQALTGLIDAVADSPDVDASRETAHDIVGDVEKYTKIGIWLCQGQSANSERQRRPRVARDLTEDDLDLDEYLWLNLVDAAVQVTRNASQALGPIDDHPAPGSAHSKPEPLDSVKLSSALRTNAQSTFTALLASTAGRQRLSSAPDTHTHTSAKSTSTLQAPPNFLSILRAFLARAASSAPSLADLRAVLSDILTAYAFEQDVLSLASELLDSDVYNDVQRAHEARQRGWRPRTQVCEICKRRAWGPGIGGSVWEDWVARERGREMNRLRKGVERSGGEEARRLERGKGRAVGDGASITTSRRASSSAATTSAVQRERDEEEDEGREGQQKEAVQSMALVLFTCRHVFHRACLDPGYTDGRAGGGEKYRCPLC